MLQEMDWISERTILLLSQKEKLNELKKTFKKSLRLRFMAVRWYVYKREL